MKLSGVKPDPHQQSNRVAPGAGLGQVSFLMARGWVGVDFDPIEAGRGAAFAADHEVGEADGNHVSEVGGRGGIFGGGMQLDDGFNIESEPVDIGDIEFTNTPIGGGGVALIGDEPIAGSGLNDEAEFAETRLFGTPAHRGLAGQVERTGLVLERDGPVAHDALAGPDVERIVERLVVVTFLDRTLAGAMELEGEVGIGDMLRGDGQGGGEFFPVFAEKERRAILGGQTEDGYGEENTGEETGRLQHVGKNGLAVVGQEFFFGGKQLERHGFNLGGSADGG